MTMNKKWLVIPSAVAGGILLNYLKVPAGAMVGSMLGTAAAQIASNTSINVPVPVKRSVRTLMGCYIGLGITAEGIRQLKYILGPASLIILGMVIITLLTTFALHKFCRWELTKSFLGSLPAGLSEIGMNAEDFKVDPIALTTIHLMRLITILTFVPVVLKIFK